MADSPPRALRFLDTALYTLAMGVGMRWLPVAAAAGPAALLLWLLAFFTFYLPLSVAVAELTARFEGEGGIYGWTRESLGPLAGFLCGWFYWISLMPFFAGTLVFLSGLFLSAVGADPGNTGMSLSLSLAIALLVTAIQLAGLRFGKWVPNFGTIGGWTVFAAVVAIAVMLMWRGQGATDFRHSSYMPTLNFNTAILWGTIFFAYTGAEAVAFLRNDVDDAMRTILRVLTIVGAGSVILYVIGTAAFLIVLPQSALTRLAGFADALRLGFVHVGLGQLAVPLIGLFALSMLGGFTAWFGVGARLPFAAGLDHFLPARFAWRHPKTGAPVPAILLQAGLMLLILLISQAGSSVAGAYDLLVAMSVLTTAVPYVLMFIAHIRCAALPPIPGAWVPPGGARTSLVLAWVGQISTLVAIACSLAPDAGDPHPVATFLKITLTAAAMTMAGLLFYWLADRRRKMALAPAE